MICWRRAVCVYIYQEEKERKRVRLETFQIEMSCLTLLTAEEEDSNFDGGERAAKRLYEKFAANGDVIFTSNRNITKKAYGALAGVTEKDDYITLENVIADGEGKRITSLLTMDLLLESCNLRQPKVDAETNVLSGLECAMAVPTNDIVLAPQSVSAVLNGAAELAMRDQMRFGFDPITEILKNCCASHTIMHSFLKSALLALYERIRNWGPSQLETHGQEMALCAALEIVSSICQIVHEAKQATTHRDVGTSVTASNGRTRGVSSAMTCTRCKAKGHGLSPVVQPLIDQIDKRYECITTNDANIYFGNKLKYDTPKEFLVKGGAKRKDIRPNTRGIQTTQDLASSAIMKHSRKQVIRKARRHRLNQGIDILMDKILERDRPMNEVVVNVDEKRGQHAEDEQPTSPVVIELSGPSSVPSSSPSLPSVADVESSVTTAVPFSSSSSPTQVKPSNSNGSSSMFSPTSVAAKTPSAPPLSPRGTPPFFFAPIPSPVSPMSPDTTHHGTLDSALAPTLERVQESAPEVLVAESQGLPPGASWTQMRDSVTNKQIAKFATRGRGINTGKYRRFNPVTTL
nr:MAG: wsv131-like protein [Metapenaeus ensis nimavirus]